MILIRITICTPLCKLYNSMCLRGLIGLNQPIINSGPGRIPELSMICIIAYAHLPRSCVCIVLSRCDIVSVCVNAEKNRGQKIYYASFHSYSSNDHIAFKISADRIAYAHRIFPRNDTYIGLLRCNLNYM